MTFSTAAGFGGLLSKLTYLEQKSECIGPLYRAEFSACHHGFFLGGGEHISELDYMPPTLLPMTTVSTELIHQWKGAPKQG